MNNRRRGHSWERRLAKMLRAIYPNVLTSRYASREQDDRGVDFVNTGCVAIQAKTLKRKPNFREVFDHMDTPLPKVFVYKDGNIRGKTGEYAVMPLEDLLTILMDLEG